jgi:methyl-accepting chemotaxis protein
MSNSIAALDVILDTYIDSALSLISSSVDRKSATIERALTFIIIILSSSVGTMAFIVLLAFARAFSKSISSFSTAIETWNAHDFSVMVEINGADELAILANKINGTIEDFSRLIDRVTAMANEATTIREDVISASTETAASIEQISANISSIRVRIGEMVNQLASTNEASDMIGREVALLDERLSEQNAALARSREAAEDMKRAAAKVDIISRGQHEEAIRLETLAMDELERIALTNEAIEGTAKDVEKVMDVVNIINAVSEQTNILAMNAAIEAANAGQAGRGFSVVAEEIRKLAESTGVNASLIGNTIGEMAKHIKIVSEASAQTNEDFRGMGNMTREARSSMKTLQDLVQALSASASGVANDLERAADNYQGIQVRSGRILINAKNAANAATVIEGLGHEINSGIGEIESGSKDTGQAMQHLRDLSWEIARSVNDLHESIAGYRSSVQEQGIDKSFEQSARPGCRSATASCAPRP